MSANIPMTNTTNQIKERIRWVDSLKGFAIIMVVLGHVAKGYLDSGLFESEMNVLKSIYKLIYSFHMPLFIMISGLLYSKAYLTIDKGLVGLKKSSYITQLLNLTIIYVLYSIVFGLFKILFASYTNYDVSATDLLMIWAKPIQLYWFLYVLIELYLIFAIKYLRNANELLMVVVLFICSVAAFAFDYTSGYFQIERILFYSLFFYVGIILNRRQDWQRIITVITYPLFALSIILLIVYWNKHLNFQTLPIAGTLIALGISLFIIDVFSRLPILGGCKVLSFIGTISLEIYIFHTYFATALRAVFKMLGVNNLLVCLSLSFIISLAGSIAIAVLCKKLGLHDIMFKPYKAIKNKR